MPNAKCQMPNAKCQMPNAKCQMPNAPNNVVLAGGGGLDGNLVSGRGEV